MLRVPEDSSEFLYWLNRPFSKEHETAIQNAFRRVEFETGKVGWKRTTLELESIDDAVSIKKEADTLVDPTGLEPVTSALQRQRSTK